jgi:hypothetical protein
LGASSGQDRRFPPGPVITFRPRCRQRAHEVDPMRLASKADGVDLVRSSVNGPLSNRLRQ